MTCTGQGYSVQLPFPVRFADNTRYISQPTSIKLGGDLKLPLPVTENPSSIIFQSARSIKSKQPTRVAFAKPDTDHDQTCSNPTEISTWAQSVCPENVNWDVLRLENSLSTLAQVGSSPVLDCYLCIFQKCRKERSSFHARVVHVHACAHGLDTHEVIQSHLVSLFVECDSMLEAQHAFSRLSTRSEFTWTCLIQGYVNSGEPQHALDLAQQMKQDGILPSKFTFVTLLKACAKMQWLERGEDLHNELEDMGLETDLFIGSILVDMYAKCGLLAKAQDVFDGLLSRSLVSWTALIGGYAEHGPREKAFKCLEQLRLEGLSPDGGAYVCGLIACVSAEDSKKGFAMHSEIIKVGFEKDQVVCNALMDMYAKCCSLEEARCVFNGLPNKSVVSWTTLIARYADGGLSQEALSCLDQMQSHGEFPNTITFVCSLKACRDLGALDKGLELHTQITTQALEKDMYVANNLVNLYANHGLIEEARDVFMELSDRDIISWTTMITAYAEAGDSTQALFCFREMQKEGLSPDVASCNAVILGCGEEVETNQAARVFLLMQEQGILPNGTTFMGILQACKSTPALAFGRRVHAQLLTSGGQKGIDWQLATALVDMYAKCGNTHEAQNVFECMPSRDIVAWTALITAYAGQGERHIVFQLLDRMRKENLQPDGDTFLSLLKACAHAGLVDEAQVFFGSMGKDFSITPTIEHVNCVVDLLGRVGRLNEAVTILNASLVPPDHVMWSTILGACRKWDDMVVARDAFNFAVGLDRNNPAAYTLMEHIYADAQLGVRRS